MGTPGAGGAGGREPLAREDVTARLLEALASQGDDQVAALVARAVTDAEREVEGFVRETVTRHLLTRAAALLEHPSGDFGESWQPPSADTRTTSPHGGPPSSAATGAVSPHASPPSAATGAASPHASPPSSAAIGASPELGPPLLAEGASSPPVIRGAAAPKPSPAAQARAGENPATPTAGASSAASAIEGPPPDTPPTHADDALPAPDLAPPPDTPPTDADGAAPSPATDAAAAHPAPAIAAPTDAEPVDGDPVEDRRGCYVYGITTMSTARPPADLAGVGGAPVRLVAHEGIGALVSDVSLAEFNTKTIEQRLGQLDWIETQARAHDAVLHHACAGGALLPLRFCTVVRSETDLRDLLAANQQPIVEGLRRVQGKEEWGVKIFRDDAAMTRQAERTSERARALEEQLARSPEGASYFLRKRRDNALAEEVDALTATATGACLQALAGAATAATQLSVQSRQRTGRDDEMVHNGAFLVARERVDDFRDVVADLATRYGRDGLRLEITGPWPPYNFAELDLVAGAAS